MPKKKTKTKPAKKTKIKVKAKKVKAVNKSAKKPSVKAKKVAVKKTQKPAVDAIGVVTHYFPQVKAAVIKVKKEFKPGDYVQFKGHTTDFKQEIKSIQIDRKPVEKALPKEEVGVEVKSRVRIGDVVTKAENKPSSPLSFLRNIWPGNS